MLIGKDNVISWIEFNKTPFWNIKSGSGEQAGIIFVCQRGDENVSLEDGKVRLTEALNKLGAGTYHIEAWTTLEQKKSRNKSIFQLTTGEGYLPQQNHNVGGYGNNNGMFPQINIQAQIDAAIEKERTANKIERLEADLKLKEARIKELESELSSTEIKLGKRMEAILGPLMDMGSGLSNNNASVGNTDADAERIGNLMEKWASKDNDFESVLGGIVKLAYNDPAKYAMGKKILTA